MKSKITSLPNRLTRIDKTNRGDHSFLEEGDRCSFFGEYFAGTGFEGGWTNQLILNFKAPPSKPKRKFFKDGAIRTIAAGLRKVVPKGSAERLTWVPIPCSKAEGHADYDERGLRALRMAFNGYDVDVRQLLKQTESTEADHAGDDRISREDLLELLKVNKTELKKAPIRPDGICLFDDVLTTGKHYKCCEERLLEVVEVPIRGLFVARCIHADPFADFKIILPDDE